ncbi:MAG: hypothetical protein V1773_10180 [bacterium]
MIYPIFVKPKNNCILFVEYSNGISADIDLKFLLKNFIYAGLVEESLFNTAFIDQKSFDICWANNISICKDMLYNHIKLLKLADNLRIDVNKI